MAFLRGILTEAGAFAGSVHRREGALLHLTAALGLPAPVRAATATIPEGKGMAGLAWRRGVPVQTCDLQTDTTGDVQPGARAVAAHAAVAVPVFDADGNVRAVVGFAFTDARTLDGPPVAALSALAQALPATAETKF